MRKVPKTMTDQTWNILARHPKKIGEASYFRLAYGDMQKKINELTDEGYTKIELWTDQNN
jgi:hypothetical protein